MEKMRFPARKGAALLLAFCMTAVMSSCAKEGTSSGSSSGSSSAASGDSSSENPYAEALTIDLFTETGNYNGEVVGWGAKVLKDKFNVTLNVISGQGDDTVYQTRAISGNLGDLIILADDVHFKDSVDAGLFLDWNKDNLFAEHGKDVAQYTDAVTFMQDTYGGGTALYAMPNNVSNRGALTPSEATEITFGSFIRFDLYQGIGAPEIKTLDDLYPTLKKMAEANPTAADGSKVYAFSLFGDWDGSLMTFAKQFGCMYGWDEISGGRSYLLQNNDASEYVSVLDPGGPYVKGLKIYNQAYRDGLLDPDSLTQNFDNVREKITGGQVLYSCWSWMAEYFNTPENTAEGKAMLFVPMTDEKIVSAGCRAVGEGYRMGIGANTKNPERIMDIINWLYTPEGMMIIQNGPEGLTWEIKDGKPAFTEFGLKVVPNNTTDDVPAEYGGGTYQGGGLGYFAAPLFTEINPETNESYTWRTWSSYLDTMSVENDPRWKALEDWRDFYDTKTQKQYLEDHDQLSVKPGTTLVPPDLDSDLMQIQGQVQNSVREASWKMVYANSDEEFNSLLTQVTETVKGFGLDKLDAFYVEYLKDLNAACEAVING